MQRKNRWDRIRVQWQREVLARQAKERDESVDLRTDEGNLGDATWILKC
jgi:hypothetical protein